jgi:hypothetical protein
MALQPPTPLANAMPLERNGTIILQEIAHWFAQKGGLSFYWSEILLSYWVCFERRASFLKILAIYGCDVGEGRCFLLRLLLTLLSAGSVCHEQSDHS